MSAANDNAGHAPSGKRAPPTRKPNRTIVVPVEYRRDYSWSEVSRISKRLSEESGCEVIPVISERYPTKFNIFGPAPQLDVAVKAVNDWIQNATAKSKTSASWAKMPAFDNNKWYYEHVRDMEIKRKQAFRGDPPEDMELLDVVVDWPEELRIARLDPMSVFGPGLIALDPIRMDEEVFISMCPHRGPVLQLKFRGCQEENLESALKRFDNMVQKIRDQGRLVEEPINIILDESEGSGIVLKRVPEWWPNKSHGVRPQLVPTGNLGNFRKKSLCSETLRDLQDHILRVLESIKYEQGSYDFTIRYGCLAISGLDEKIDEAFTIPQFLKGLKVPKISFLVTKWAGDSAFGERLLDGLMAANDILAPAKTGGHFGFGLEPASLPETRPTLQGTWVLQDPNSVNQKIVVQIQWTEDEEGLYEKMPIRYFRLKDGKNVPKENLDVTLMELGESNGWHFGLESMTSIRRSTISPVITTFAESVKIKPGYGSHIRSQVPFALWTETRSTKTQTCRLDKIYTFLIRNTKYHVEARQLWYPGRREPCWGLIVRHNEWSTHLDPLETLSIGRAADFGNTSKKFFPDDGGTSMADMPDIGSLSVRNGSDIAGIDFLCKALMRVSVVINKLQTSR